MGGQAVALLAEGVDRNITLTYDDDHVPGVALLAEGVDRNRRKHGCTIKQCVALLAEGVDRNSVESEWNEELNASPSSRRAWIEITFCFHAPVVFSVALLAEGVDRNDDETGAFEPAELSPSSRRAWIEIVFSPMNSFQCSHSRPPRGGRG